MNQLTFIIIAVLGLAFGFIFYIKSRNLEGSLRGKREELNQKVFELSILKELGERIGYSLDVNKIIDIITGSIHQLIEYNVVSYMLLGAEKIIFKSHIEKSVNRKFIDDIKNSMLQSLSAITGKDFKPNQIDETLSGAVLVDELNEPVRSFFNIPIVIGGRVLGILTIAHIKSGLYKEGEMTMLYRIMQQASSAVTKLEELVQTEQQKLNSMVESMADGIVMVDKDYRILVANPSAKRVMDASNKKDITIFDVMDSLEGKFAIRNKLEESIRLDKILETPAIIINDRFFQIFVSPVKSNYGITKGQTLGAVAIFHDITSEKEVEKLREDFTSIMVHELRSPLDGIKKRIEVLSEGGEYDKDKAKRAEILSVVYKNASHMLELVNDLLDAAKLTAGKFEFHKQPADIKQLIQDRVSFFSVLAKDQGIGLEIKIDPGLPEQFEFDPLRIEQSLNNLISNAIKFTDSGGKATVQALLHKKGRDIIKEAQDAGIDWFIKKPNQSIQNGPDSVLVAVTDTGIGISEENIKQLFNKFKQFQSAAKRADKKGTGLGLVIAKGIIEGHGGMIGIDSEEGKGSTFYFSIPI